MSEKSKLAPTITGQVVSAKMDKTVVVRVERKVRHPLGKYVKRSSKIFAHDENKQCREGDTVVIKQCRPLSKNKSWTLVKVLESAS